MTVLDRLLGSPLRQPAECIVRVGTAEREISDLYPYLTEVDVRSSRDGATTARLVFETRREADGRWSVQDGGVFAPWERLRIDAAFGSVTEEVMRGYVREVRAAYPEDPGATIVTVTGQDDSFAMDREHVRTVWGADAPTTDSVVLGTILGRHRLAPSADNGPGLTGLVLNQNGTDARFLLDRARANGYELLVERGSVYFGPMRVDAESQPAIMVYAGRDTNCLRFDVRSDGHRAERVAYDTAAAQGAGSEEQVVEPDLALLGTQPAAGGGSGLADFTWRLDRHGGAGDDELAARAQGRANELSMRVRADGELDGSLYGHVLRVGLPVAVDGVGQWLGGTYYVDAAHHRFSVDGYRIEFTLLRNAYGDDLGAGGGGALAGLL